MMSSSQFYGAGQFLPKRRGLLPNASWTHGIIFRPFSPYQIISREDSVFDYHLVTDEIEAEIAGEAFDNVLPVGLPFAHVYHNLYIRDQHRDLNRLFLSSHSIRGESGSSLQDLVRRAEALECDAIVLPGHQFELAFGGRLDEAIVSRIRVFRGAYARDFGSYRRIVSLFSRTKVLVTDCVGSHIYYAAACECHLECELADVTENFIREKTRAVLLGLKEPWRSSMAKHLDDYKITESIVSHFLQCSQTQKYEIALERIGYKFIGNLENTRNEVLKSSLPSLFIKNLKLLSTKIDARRRG